MYQLKIGDFGLSKTLEATKHSYGIGTPKYAAPEQGDAGDGKYDSKVDVYSIGAMLFEFLIGKDPL